MKFNKTFLTAAVRALGGFTAMSGANAAETTDNFGITLKVDSICTISSVGDVDLGSIQAGQATSAVSQTSTLVLNCSEGALPVISLSPSSKSVDGKGTMKGASSDQTVPYKLTSDLAGDTPWGSAGNTVSLAAATNYITDIETTIYATVEGIADVKPDTYTDTVQVTVSY